MLLFTSHVYQWPKSLLEYLASLFIKFLWSGKQEERKYIIMAWEKVCLWLEGGLGLKDLFAFNQAAILKTVWNLLTSQSLLQTFMKAKYKSHQFDNTHFVGPSSIWNGFKLALKEVEKNACWIAGNGEDILFWKDNWLGKPLYKSLNISSYILPRLHTKVSALIANNEGKFLQKWFQNIDQV